MAKELYNESIDKHTDWGGDSSTGGKAVSGARVQEFLKDTLEQKAGCFYYDSSNQRYLVFSDEENRDLYLDDPQSHASLLIAAFDAPSEYDASIDLLSDSIVSILTGTTGNYIRFTFDVVNRSGASVGDNVNCTYTFRRGSRVQVVNARYAYGTTVALNIDPYLLDGTNTITIAISGVNTLAATTYAVTYNVINLQLTDSFDISKVYGASGTLAIPYHVEGSGTKTLEWYIDGTKQAKVTAEDEIVNVEYSGTKYIAFSGLGRGVHHLQFRCSIQEGGETFYSHWLYREFIVQTGSTTTPMVAVKGTVLDGSADPIASGHRMTFADLTQYVPYTLEFACYNPSGVTTTDVSIYLDGALKATAAVANEQMAQYVLIPTTDGDHQLNLKAGNVNSYVSLDVAATNMDIHEITTNLALDFSALGRSNASASDTRSTQTIAGKDASGAAHNYTARFNGFKWNNLSGWYGNRLVIDAGSTFSIDIAPLSWNVKQHGLTFELEFATTNVSDDDTVILDMLLNSVGLKVTASEASLSNSIWIGNADTEKRALKTRYKSGETYRIAYVINPFANVTNHGLVFIYVNGRISGAKAYTSASEFTSGKTFSLSGDTTAVVEFKQLRIYSTALSPEDVYNNYVLYRDTLDEMMAIYDHNDIYIEGTTTLDPDKLANHMPVMLFTGDIPALENEYQDKKKQIVVDVEYINMQDPTKSFTMKNATLTPQGTSSMGFPKKNYRLYSRKYTQALFLDWEGNEITDGLYSFKDGAQPVACWCLKADYAESSSSHNTGVARLWNKLLYDAKVTYDASETSSSTNSVNNAYALRTNAQNAALENNYEYDVRTCVDGFPIMCFYRPDEDSDYIFIGKYNFNNDKSTESVFGFKDIPGFDNTHMQCWELLDNSHDLSLMKSVSGFDDDWSEAFESRYPDTSTPTATLPNLKSFITWVVGSTIGSSTFKTQKWSHLDVYKMAAYYVYLMVFGAVDQTTKNSMLTSEDGVHYYFINYDNDTILGVRNDGILVFGPDIDRQSLDTSYQGITAYAYAGHDNKLWNLLEGDTEFMAIVQTVYASLYGAGLNYANLVDMFDNQQSLKWCERVANLDADYKYLSPYRSAAGTDHLEMLQGARSAHRRWWLSKRLAIYDAKFVSGEYKSKIFGFKVNGSPSGLGFTIKAGVDLYYGYGIQTLVYVSGVSLSANETHTFTLDRQLAIGDPVSIYAGIYLKEVDISDFFLYLTDVEMTKVYSEETGITMLTKVVMGTSSGTNTSLTTLSGLAAANNLEYLDIRGYAGITSLDLTANKYVTTLLAQRSGCGQIDFVDGSAITTLGLPSTLQVLSLQNCPKIKPSGITFEDTYGMNIKTIEVRGCTQSTMKSAWSMWYNWFSHKTTPNAQCSVYIDNIAWTNVAVADLLAFSALRQGSLTLKGSITLASSDLTAAQIAALRAAFGEHCFESGNDLVIKTIEDVLILDGPTELVEGTSAQYHLTVISTKTGTVSYVLSNPSSRQGVSLSDNGLLTVEETGAADSTVVVFARFTPTSGIMVQRSINVTIKKFVYPPISAVTLGGPTVLTDVNSTLTATFANPEDYSGYAKCEVVWTLTGDMASHFSITSQNKTSCNVRRLNTNFVYIQGTVTYTLQYLRGNETVIIGSKTYSIGAYDNTQIAVSDAINHPLMSKMWALYGTNGTKVAGKIAHETYITKAEAHSFTDDDMVVGTSAATGMFYSIRSTLTNFDELQWFDQLTTIPDHCFDGCTKLTHVTLPNSMVRINQYAFSATGIVTIDIPLSVTTLGLRSFYNCGSLSAFRADGVTEALRTFEHCVKLKTIYLPELTTSPSQDFCSSCPLLEEIYTPKLERLAGWWYGGDTPNLKRWTIGSFSSTNIGGRFIISKPNVTIVISPYCNSLSGSVGVLCGCAHYEVDSSNMAYTKNGNVVVEISTGKVVLCDNVEAPILPPSVTSIGNYAFNGCTNLTDITIPSSVTSIGNSAFEGCSSLSEMYCYANDISAPSGAIGTIGANNDPIEIDGVQYKGIIHVPSTSTGYNRGDWLNVTDAAKSNFCLIKDL